MIEHRRRLAPIAAAMLATGLAAVPARGEEPGGEALLGAAGGLRPWLARAGVVVSLTEQDEVLANVSGGRSRTADYDGLTIASVRIDTGARFWPGGTIYASALHYHGRDLSFDTLQALQPPSGNQEERGARLSEWYLDQQLPHGLDLRVGQQALDQEFILNATSAVMLNNSFGWPLLPPADLPGGGPSFPLSVPGVRLRAGAAGSRLLVGLYNGSPVHAGCKGDALQCNTSGTSFPLDGGLLAIAEAQFRLGAPAQAATYKLGGWIDTQSFPDQRLDRQGRPLARPDAGPPQRHQGDWSVYGTVDQVVWSRDARSLTAFGRAMVAPADRNPISISVNAGAVLKGPLPGRDDDSLGLGLGYGRVSDRLRGADQDAAAFGGPRFARSAETVIEATYQYAATGWCQIQPDLQYLFSPGGSIPTPDHPARRLRNALVLGLHTAVVF